MNDRAHRQAPVLLFAKQPDVVFVGAIQFDMIVFEPGRQRVQVVGNRRFRHRKHVAVHDELFHVRKAEQLEREQFAALLFRNVRNEVGGDIGRQPAAVFFVPFDSDSPALPADHIQMVRLQIGVLEFSKNRASRNIQSSRQLVDRNIRVPLFQDDLENLFKPVGINHHAPTSSLTISSYSLAPMKFMTGYTVACGQRSFARSTSDWCVMMTCVSVGTSLSA